MESLSSTHIAVTQADPASYGGASVSAIRSMSSGDYVEMQVYTSITGSSASPHQKVPRSSRPTASGNR